ncbi:MAG: 3-phosphoshikimate 1-carboxyvinyltransferase [Thermoanaerobaculales bacterium]|nr:3-phosphoshikimate 1-carboxyvinyltransferase [Thermoanaerobaculales bacterium]
MIPRELPGPHAELDAAVEVPSSKSISNRALIAAAAAGGGRIRRPLDCGDTRVLAAALAAAGWPVEWRDEVTVGGRSTPAGRPLLDLADSGTGARLILGLLAALPGRATVDGSPRLRERPMAPLLEVLGALGARIEAAGGFLPATVEGHRLAGGRAAIRPGLSSQFVSSLLLAAPLMQQGLELEVAGPLPSAPYLDLTSEVLRAFGSEVVASADRRLWQVPAGGLRPSTLTVEGDWSAAAFLLAAAAVTGGRVTVGPLDPRSRQGDRAVLEVLAAAGLRCAWQGEWVSASGPVADPIAADLESTPDLFPALAVVAACAPPGSRLTGLGNLAHKESDRLTVMVANLRGLGAVLEVGESALTVASPLRRQSGAARPVTAAGDHRVAMAMAVAALAAGPLTVDDGSCVGKSFPGFWAAWEGLVAGARDG